MPRLGFQIDGESPGSRARAARFRTLHGEVKTPIFMPVGTQATVKSQTVDSLKTAGSHVLLANTYHLLLRPGPEVFRKFGGIHRFMNWDGPVLTDSGGFQIFSLPHSREMNEEGASFQSYVDGRMHLLSPEKSIEMQRAIGSDIMMVLDQCIPSTAEHAQALQAMELTHRWAKRSLAAREDSPQAMFGIVQGACFQDLRRQSADFLTQLPFDGFAIGGLAVGETKGQREDFTEWTAALLPRDLPRYLMGVGTPIDILEAVHRGVDMFDCILPSALAQRGVAFTSVGKLQLRRGVYKFSEEPLDPDCGCATCVNYSRAYLHHLYKAEEVVGWKLLASHNLTFYHRLMAEMREAILQGKFLEYYQSKREELVLADEENPVKKQKNRSRREKKTCLGDYEIHSSPHGFSSIRQLSSGEIMHSVIEPTQEAETLYVKQSRLAERLLETQAPLVIWDVGLGAATNAMAAIHCFEAQGAPARGLKIVSFERDLDPLRLASLHPVRFPHLRHGAPYRLLEESRWESSNQLLQWELLEGDFLDHLESAPMPDLIFYDPFSSKTDSALWTPSVFSRIYRRCLSQEENHAVELMTYSASTAVRAALLSAGFFVARGAATGPKSDTTLAVTRRSPPLDDRLLGAEWLQRWNRSESKYPAGIAEAERSRFEALILSHPQFAREGISSIAASASLAHLSSKRS
ncbi:MAG: tRNA guanosine(34) transglycosylase Tgt [Oligoflexia bacterium]|nr:tRNA guanosine(34) transglycosylase Tgt [Oligoflexia bacterium]